MSEPRRIFITVAEVSGDQHAAQLVAHLRRLDPTAIIEGLGGQRMRDAGAVIHHETVQSAAVGPAAVRRVPEVLRLLRWTSDHFARHRPDLQICCDSWSMNANFARQARAAGVPVLYYIAPQVWASRPWRVKKLRKVVDKLACILPFEQDYFRSREVDATFVGHPLFDELPPRPPLRPARTITADSPPVVGLLPGSRRGEAEKNFGPMLAVAERIKSAFPRARFVVPATSATEAVVSPMLGGRSDVQVRVDAFDELVPQCDLCITVSGTATLHVAGHGVPMIVVYRRKAWEWHLLGRWVVTIRTFALVNLLSDHDKHIVPEFVPWFGPIDSVADTAVDLLTHPQKRQTQIDRIGELVAQLDKPGASARVAEMAMVMIAARADGLAPAALKTTTP